MKGTNSMTTLHNASRLSAAFDDDHTVANAALVLVCLLNEPIGLEEFCEEKVDLAPFPGKLVVTLVQALVAGASCVDVADVMRSGATSSILSLRVMAPSTRGTLRRGLTFNHYCGVRDTQMKIKKTPARMARTQ
jgi:hypothetical protein